MARTVRPAKRAPEKPKPAPSAQRHVRTVTPLVFRAEEAEHERVPETPQHVDLCKALHQVVQGAVSAELNSIGDDQLVYFRANDPTFCLAPDVFVKLGVADESFACWKSWEKGAPDLAFEVLDSSNSGETWSLDEKLRRYHELGVAELVVFEVDAPAGQRLRVWDRIDGDFLERVVEAERTPCCTLGGELTVGRIALDERVYSACVRLVGDDGTIVPTLIEARTAAARAEELAATAARELEEAERAEAQSQRAEALSRRAEAVARGEAIAVEREAEAARSRARR